MTNHYDRTAPATVANKAADRAANAVWDAKAARSQAAADKAAAKAEQAATEAEQAAASPRAKGEAAANHAKRARNAATEAKQEAAMWDATRAKALRDGSGTPYAIYLQSLRG